jgi:hypothetical protein
MKQLKGYEAYNQFTYFSTAIIDVYQEPDSGMASAGNIPACAVSERAIGLV